MTRAEIRGCVDLRFSINMAKGGEGSAQGPANRLQELQGASRLLPHTVLRRVAWEVKVRK